jgi:transmembrane sensor
MNAEIITKYLSGKCSDKELEGLYEWVKLSEENKQFFSDIRNAWAIANMTERADDKDRLQGEYEKLLQKLEKDDVLGEDKHLIRRPASRWGTIKRFAAVVLITIGLSTVVNYLIWHDRGTEGANHQLVVPSGQQAQLTLSDGTKIWLNARSKLIYPGRFASKKREVMLEGEGFFEVTHDSKKPFIVKTSDLNIKVLGTSFNISSYQDDNEVKLTLVNGAVSILEKTSDQEMARLAPDQMAVFSKADKKITVSKVETDFYTSWKEGQFKFRQMSFEEIAKRLSRNFNMEFVFRNKNIKNITYTGSFYNYEPLIQILEIMQKNSPFVFDIKKNQVLIK